MKHASEQAAGFWTPRPSSLDGVLSRLDNLSRKPEFMLQRELALARALKPYLERGAGRLVAPLEQEVELASLYLFCDYYPDDGQLTIIEQLRDIITEHIPEEERQWLDPLKHSYLDVLKPTSPPTPGLDLVLQSLADETRLILPRGEFARDLAADRPVLTRVIHDPNTQEPDRAVWAGCGITVSQADAEALLDITSEWRREMEMTTGYFALGEWKEFAKPVITVFAPMSALMIRGCLVFTLTTMSLVLNVMSSLAAVTDTNEGTGWRLYTNARFGFSVRYPDDWRLGNPLPDGVGVTLYPPIEHSLVALSGHMNVVSGSSQDGRQTLKEFADAHRRIITDLYEKKAVTVKWRKDQDTTLAGFPAKQVTFTYSDGKQGQVVEHHIISLGRNEGRGIRVKVPLLDEERLLSTIKRMLGTYQPGRDQNAVSPVMPKPDASH